MGLAAISGGDGVLFGLNIPERINAWLQAAALRPGDTAWAEANIKRALAENPEQLETYVALKGCSGKVFMFRVAALIRMIVRKLLQVVAEATMPRQLTQRAPDGGATCTGQGFAGGLLCCEARPWNHHVLRFAPCIPSCKADVAAMHTFSEHPDLYCYRGRFDEAEAAARTALEKSAVQAGVEGDWRTLTAASTDWSQPDGPARLLLYSLKALVFISLRQQRPDEAGEILALLERLDPEDRVGASVVREMAAVFDDEEAR